MKKVRIRTKLLLATVAVGFIALLASGLIGYDAGGAAIEKESFNKLTAVREMKARQLEAYFQQIRSQVVTMSENRMVVNAMTEMREAFH